MSLALETSHTFQSKFHNIKLVATEFDEPLNGLTLWRFRLYRNNTIFHHKYLDYENKFCGLPSNLENFELESAKGNYLYIPYGLLLLNTETLELEKYNIETGANNHFLMNTFISNHLVVLHERAIYIVDIEKKELFQKIYPYQQRKFHKIISDQQEIKFLYKDKTTDQTGILRYTIQTKTLNNEQA
ncbi:hypothetical protein ETU08_08100 [Apibacter muscae]|uniref:hypothetical protein n=1 Tax=Apibacter muscae TaxID=2509004 RepID=UPI0011AD9D88|nr:hypothetical protein [Apibacter muscae]TWP29236.1 hypothetical protein ETU08_08100 [Apibacter muscae]